MSRYSNSEEWLQRAERTIPLGAQTFSKSRTQYPLGVSPLFADKASGPYLWDIDGHRYVDLVSSLASITLGYNDTRVNRAVKKQLKKGVSYSLSGKLEAEVAELICELVPSAEMVRFGKNGTDATSAAVRLARAYTGKDRVLVCGYHGWQDWYIGSTTRNKGVPTAVSELTSPFNYNDIESLHEQLAVGNIACIVMEPMNVTFPKNNFLSLVRKIATENGIVLIFDETITGFRFSEGGAQELFGVTPDLSTFGKGMANGFPLSAVVGKREIMSEMENIFFSGTFGGELLSLAAAKEVLKLHAKKNIVPELKEKGNHLTAIVEKHLDKLEMNGLLQLSGHPTWKFLNWKLESSSETNKVKTLFMQEMFQNGVLILGTHNVNLAMDKRALSSIDNAYSKSLSVISKALESGSIDQYLKCRPIEPLFKIR